MNGTVHLGERGAGGKSEVDPDTALIQFGQEFRAELRHHGDCNGKADGGGCEYSPTEAQGRSKDGPVDVTG